jgi:hypothetical protein
MAAALRLSQLQKKSGINRLGRQAATSPALMNDKGRIETGKDSLVLRHVAFALHGQKEYNRLILLSIDKVDISLEMKYG